MGAWGGGSFANDDAADWAGELVDGGTVDDVRLALATAAECASDEYLEAPDGSQALAAAELVAAARGRPASVDAYSEAAIRWAGAHEEIAAQGWVALAQRAVDRVQAPDSELRELWLDDEGADPDAAREWTEGVENLRARLSG